MEEPSSNPAFEARSLKSASGWYVRVAWPNGKRDHVPGFVTQHSAGLKARPQRGCRSVAARPKHLVVLQPHRSLPIDTDADMSPRTGFRVRGDGQCNQLHLNRD
jgi:hypothetical protein